MNRDTSSGVGCRVRLNARGRQRLGGRRLQAPACLTAVFRYLVVLPLVLTGGACGVGGESTACDGFAGRKLAVTRAEYRGCAGEIVAALDALERPVRTLVAGTATDEDRNAARREFAKVRRRIRQTGIEADYRSAPGAVAMKWPDGTVSGFNTAAFTASVQYGAVLAFPNTDNLDQGLQAHRDARRYYRHMQ